MMISMPRRPAEQLPQDQLSYELRHAIDWARRRPNARALSAIRDLLVANPNGARSSHVRHNLGQARRAWLSHLITSQKTLVGQEGGPNMVRENENPPVETPPAPAQSTEKSVEVNETTETNKESVSIKADATPDKKG